MRARWTVLCLACACSSGAGCAAEARIAPSRIHCPAPVYPRAAQDKGEQGKVALALLVGADGKVHSATVSSSSGYPALDGAARDALQQCRFRAAHADGLPMAATTIVDYQFELDLPDAPARLAWRQQLLDIEEGVVNGEADAQFLLGELIRSGRQHAAKLEKAAGWYRKAAEQGHAAAQYQLALMLSAGVALPQDVPEALRWLRQAAASGNSDAQNRLGALHEDGFGVAQDAALAAHWYALAAAQGHVLGQYNLGQCYELGLGVPPDRSQAEHWYASAEAQGDLLAHKALAALRRSR